MPDLPRFAVSLAREGAAGRGWAQGPVLLVTVVLALLVVPGPWDGRAQAVATLPERELVGLRSARSKTFREGDGRLRTTLYEQSVHFLDRSAADEESSPDGKWREIDASFADSAKAGVGWESGANRFSVELAQATRDGLVRFTTRAGSVSLSLLGASVGKQGAKAGKNKVAFGDVLPGVDVEYAVLPDGLKESIVLRNASAPSEFRFTLVPDAGTSWRAEKREGDVFWFMTDSQAEPAFVLLAPVVGDSAGLGGRGAGSGAPPVFSGATGKASMAVESQADGSFVVVMGIDEEWLRDPERVFPVVLDPTLGVGVDSDDGEYVTTTGSLPNTSAPTMRTGKNGSGGSTYASVATFDLGVLPAGVTILDARLNLYLDGCFPSACSSSSTGDVELRYLTLPGWSSATPWPVNKFATVQDKVSLTSTPALQWY